MPILLRTSRFACSRLRSSAHALPARVRALAVVPAPPADFAVGAAEDDALDLYRGLLVFLSIHDSNALFLGDAQHTAQSPFAVALYPWLLPDLPRGALVPLELRDPPATPAQRRLARMLQKGLCAMCGLPLGERHVTDHIFPRWEGGSSKQSNLQALHCECHKVKTKEEWPRLTKARKDAKNGMIQLLDERALKATIISVARMLLRSVEIISSEQQLGRPGAVAGQKKVNSPNIKMARKLALAIASLARDASRLSVSSQPL